MKNILIIFYMALVLAVFFIAEVNAVEEGYEVTISEKTDLFMNKDKIATIPEMALFRAQKIRDDWVFGTYKDVETEQVYTGWIQKKVIGDLDKMYEALKAESANYLLDGERYFQEGKYAEAIKFLTESLDRHPAQPHVLQLRAQSFLALGRKTEAIADYSTIIRTAAGSEEAPDALLSRAKLLIEAKNYQAATSDLQQVLKTHPDNAEAYLYLGNIQFYQKAYQNALALYQKGLETGSTISALYYQRGLTYFYLNMFDESRADLEKAISISKENAEYQKAYDYVNQQVKMLESITPDEVKKILDVKIARKDEKLIIQLTNNSNRPLLNIEVAMVAFLENPFRKVIDEGGPTPTKEPSKDGRKEKIYLEPTDVEVQGIKYLPGIVRGSTVNIHMLESKPFPETVKEKKMKYYGYIVIVFVNKQEVFFRADPRDLKEDYKDTVIDMYVEVQGEKAK